MDKPKNLLTFKKLKDILIIGFSFILFLILGNGNLCYLKATLGIPCPGCGLTRSYISLFKGDFNGALHYHPLFIVPPLIFLIIALHHIPIIKIKIINKLYNSKVFWISIIVLFLGVYIVRMILFFPRLEPMTFNKNSILFRIINFRSYF